MAHVRRWAQRRFVTLSLGILTAWCASAPALAARIITLAPHVTELFYAAGAGDQIVATVQSSDFPPEARSLPRVGQGLHLDAERILALRPDLIAGWREGGPTAALAPLLTRPGIHLMHLDPRRLLEIPDALAAAGAAAGTTDIAGPRAAALRARILDLERRYHSRPAVRVFIELGSAPLYTIGRDALINDALRVCGGVNIYGTSALSAPQVSRESVLVHQPDLVLTTGEDGRDPEARRRAWAALHLEAALRGQVRAIDPDRLFRPTPRMVDATEALCTLIQEAREARKSGKLH